RRSPPPPAPRRGATRATRGARTTRRTRRTGAAARRRRRLCESPRRIAAVEPGARFPIPRGRERERRRLRRPWVRPWQTLRTGSVRDVCQSLRMLLTSARLLRLLSILQAREFWTGGELARRLEVTERTLRRDVDRLRSLGYPVHSTSGTAGGYQLGAGATLPPLLLDDDEAVAVALGLRTATSKEFDSVITTAPAHPAPASWNRTASCIPVIAGISWRGIWSAKTGEPS